MGRDFEKEIDEIKKNIKEMANNIDIKAINRQISNAVQEVMRSFNFKVNNDEKTDEQKSDTDSTEIDSNELLKQHLERMAEKSKNEDGKDSKERLKQIMEEKAKENINEDGKHDFTGLNKALLVQIQNHQRKMREDNNTTGYVSYCGNFVSSDRESRWNSSTTNTDDLLTLIENKSAVKVLNCIGNSMRLDILLAIMKKPMTVAQLVEHFGSNSTGQIYHHLGPLITADLIVEDENNKGLYIVQPHRVQGIIMMLAGINDMIDTKYTEGDWNPES